MNDLPALLGAEMAREARTTRPGFDPATLLRAARRGARGKRRARASLQAFGFVALAALSGGAAWLLLGHQTAPIPGVSPTPTVSPSVSPSAAPIVSPTVPPKDISGPYTPDEYGLPVFPAADAGVFAKVGPGWVLAEYAGLVPDGSKTREDGLYLVNPAGEAYDVGRIGQGTVVLWRPERNEVVISVNDVGTHKSVHVHNLVTGVDTLIDPQDRSLAYRGTTDDGHEMWLAVDPSKGSTTAILAVTTDPGQPDTVFVPYDTSNSISWWPSGDGLIAVPGDTIGTSAGSTTVQEVSTDGVTTAHTLTLPAGAADCQVASHFNGQDDLLWYCPGSAGWVDETSKLDGAWLLPLDGGPATWVPADKSWHDHYNAVGNLLPGSDGVDLSSDPNPLDRPVHWFLEEYPDR